MGANQYVQIVGNGLVRFGLLGLYRIHYLGGVLLVLRAF